MRENDGATSPGRSRPWLDRLFAERQVYVRGPGRPHFVTITRRTRLLRACALLALLATTAALGALAVSDRQRVEALSRELASLREEQQRRPAPAGPPAAPSAPAKDAAAPLRQALDAERAAHARATAEVERLKGEAERLRGQLAAAARAPAQPPATVVPAVVTPAPAPMGPTNNPDRVRELEAEVAELRRRNAELEGFLGRKAPPPPPLAPR